MGKALRKLKKRVRGEQADIQKATKKRGLWSKLGSTLIGGLAVLATGGAASPFVAAMMAGGGSLLGGHLGNLIAGRTKGGKLSGGRFFQGERADLGSQIKEGINVGALESGLYAGLGQAGGWKELLGGGKEVAAGGQKLSIGEKIFKGGAGKQTEGFGKLFDFKGSFIGKKASKIGEALQLRKLQASGAGAKKLQLGKGAALGEEFIGTGKLPIEKGKVPDLESLFKKELDMPAIEGFSTQDELTRAKLGQLDIEDIPLRGQSQWEAYKGSGPSFEAVSEPSIQYQTPGFKGKMQRILPGGESGYQIDKPLGQQLTTEQRGLYDTINRMEDEGYRPTLGKEGSYLLPEEYGKGYIDPSGQIVRPPERPNVPLDIDDTYLDTPIGDIPDYGFSEFGPWETPPELPKPKRISASFDPWEQYEERSAASRLMDRSRSDWR